MEKKAYDRLEALLKAKPFQELDEKDKAWVRKEIGGELAYDQLQEIVLGLSKEKHMKTSADVKKELVKRFKHKHQTVWGQILSYRVPAVAGTFIWILLALVLFYLLPAKQQVVEKHIAVETTRVDTLLVQLPADTVFIHRTVRVEVPVEAPKPREEKESKTIIVKGNALSEQKGLQRLLVSGEEI